MENDKFVSIFEVELPFFMESPGGCGIDAIRPWFH